MAETSALERFLAAGQVDPAVFSLRPDYRAVLLAVDGMVPGRRRSCRGSTGSPTSPTPSPCCTSSPSEVRSSPGRPRTLAAAADELVVHLTRLGPDVRVAHRVVSAATALTGPDEGA